MERVRDIVRMIIAENYVDNKHFHLVFILDTFFAYKNALFKNRA